jgi:hypothetical protein
MLVLVCCEGNSRVGAVSEDDMGLVGGSAIYREEEGKSEPGRKLIMK